MNIIVKPLASSLSSEPKKVEFKNESLNVVNLRYLDSKIQKNNTLHSNKIKILDYV